MWLVIWAAIFTSPCSTEAVSVLLPPDQNYTALHRAAEACDLQEGRAALAQLSHQRKQEDLNRFDREGDTPLAYAARRGCLPIVELLIEAGAIADARREPGSGWTPLLHAAAHGHADVLRYLLTHGADANVKARAGQTALTEAILGPIFHHGREGHRDATVQVLLVHGANVNLPGRFGWTPLMTAVLRGDAEVARLLLRNGADASVKDDHGHTAWHYAQERGEQDVIEILRLAEGGKALRTP